MLNIEILVLGSHEYQWLLKPFSLLFKKYWNEEQKIIYLSDKLVEDLPPSFSFRKFENVHSSWNFVDDFGHSLRETLKKLNSEIIIMLLSDMWLRAPADLDGIAKLIKYIRKRREVVRVTIGNENRGLRKGAGKLLETWDSLKIYTTSLDNPDFGMRAGALLWPSLWKRQTTIELIEDCTFWDFEVRHSEIMKSKPFFGVWTYESLFPYVHVHFREHGIRKLSFVPGYGFSEEDQELAKSVLPDDVEFVQWTNR